MNEDERLASSIFFFSFLLQFSSSVFFFGWLLQFSSSVFLSGWLLQFSSPVFFFRFFLIFFLFFSSIMTDADCSSNCWFLLLYDFLIYTRRDLIEIRTDRDLLVIVVLVRCG